MDETVPGFLGWLSTEAGKVPLIGTSLTLADHAGACKARWGIGRMDYTVPAGLYAIGSPTPEDPVVVTANYKMSYDIVRRALAGRSAWLLVLETFGINVWCAAGKGTFGTDELVRRLDVTGLAKVVNHRRLILPILGAPGVAAHEVRDRSGFSLGYGPIRADDLPAYLDNGMKATAAMRELEFSLYDRLVLIPVEIVLGLKSVFLTGALVFSAAALAGGASAGFLALALFLGAVVNGMVITPILLPWIPGRSFAFKGALIGIVFCASVLVPTGGNGWSLPVIIGMLLSLPSVSAFYALNFTGCTNYTSRSGVQKEMRLAIPLMGSAIILGGVLLLSRLLL